MGVWQCVSQTTQKEAHAAIAPPQRERERETLHNEPSIYRAEHAGLRCSSPTNDPSFSTCKTQQKHTGTPSAWAEGRHIIMLFLYQMC